MRSLRYKGLKSGCRLPCVGDQPIIARFAGLSVARRPVSVVMRCESDSAGLSSRAVCCPSTHHEPHTRICCEDTKIARRVVKGVGGV